MKHNLFYPKIGDKVDGTVPEQVKNWLTVIMEKYKNCMRPRLLGDKKANKTENMAESVFLREGGWGGGGVSDIQCLIYQENNVNPFQICKNWIQLNMVFYVITLFLET